jgi:hypothetical protein
MRTVILTAALFGTLIAPPASTPATALPLHLGGLAVQTHDDSMIVQVRRGGGGRGGGFHGGVSTVAGLVSTGRLVGGGMELGAQSLPRQSPQGLGVSVGWGRATTTTRHTTTGTTTRTTATAVFTTIRAERYANGIANVGGDRAPAVRNSSRPHGAVPKRQEVHSAVS